MTRQSGVLLHITSLPTRFGIGDLGPTALAFGEFLVQAGQSRWQLLPMTPTATSLGNSPYSSFSAFAGNPLAISPEVLLEEGLISEPELEAAVLPGKKRVDFAAVERTKPALLRRVFDRLMPNGAGGLEDDPGFGAFRGDNASWLPDYALFMALKDRFGGAPWTDWPRELRQRREEALRTWGTTLHREITYHQFCQWLFFRQWGRLKWQLSKLDVELVGDVPIYVTHDSADVWANQGLFKLDAEGRATQVAGVPPDYFSKTGQRWGNPVFNWQAHADTGFGWWISRMRHNFGLYGTVRLDHFRGFEAYWEIPAREKTAVNGAWMPSPGAELLEAVRAAHGSLPLIAEDLGIITEEVVALKERFGLPGMKVLQFAFGPHTPTSPDSPHNHEKNSVVYTGTHDNNTTRGWFAAEAGTEMRRLLARYLGRAVGVDTITRELVRVALSSPANCSMFPAQDLLDLDGGHRMNTPGVAKGNWGWRLPQGRLLSTRVAEGGADRGLAERLRGLCELYGRTQAADDELLAEIDLTEARP